MDIEKVVAALAEYGREMVESDTTVQELRAEVERLKEELSSSTNHYNGIINDLVKLRDEALADRDRLKTELEQVKRESVNAVTVSFPGMPSSGGGGGGSACGNNHVPDSGKMVRPEPSRLEIAAMLYKGMLSSGYVWGDPEKTALRQADALIAEAKEVTK